MTASHDSARSAKSARLAAICVSERLDCGEVKKVMKTELSLVDTQRREQ